MADITTIIGKLQENDLRTQVIIPTLWALGVYKVEDWHGSNENGIDIYFAYFDPFGDYKHCACFIKAGDITKSGKADVRKMNGQLLEAINRPFTNPIDKKSDAKTEEIYVVCNGQVNKDASAYIKDLVYAHSLPSLRIIDLDKLVHIISNKIISKINDKLGKPYLFDLKDYSVHCKSLK